MFHDVIITGEEINQLSLPDPIGYSGSYEVGLSSSKTKVYRFTELKDAEDFKEECDKVNDINSQIQSLGRN